MSKYLLTPLKQPQMHQLAHAPLHLPGKKLNPRLGEEAVSIDSCGPVRLLQAIREEKLPESCLNVENLTKPTVRIAIHRATLPVIATEIRSGESRTTSR